MKNSQTASVQKDQTVVAFTKVDLPYGWMGNMAPYPLQCKGKRYLTSEALFQCLRFEGHPTVQEEIRAESSPMAAKMKAKKHKALLQEAAGVLGEPDLERMKVCLKLKLEQHPRLKLLLLQTGQKQIIEDSSKRASKSGLFWGAKWIPEKGKWEGNNALGKLWMEIRGGLHAQGACQDLVA
jgi:ribA/ribD-fused uncharacterized protein